MLYMRHSQLLYVYCSSYTAVEYISIYEHFTTDCGYTSGQYQHNVTVLCHTRNLQNLYYTQQFSYIAQ